MMDRKAIIIGSGLGGLECGFILAKHGYEVTVLEQDKHIGGCLQTFHRNGLAFDTGFHYLGGLDEGQSLRPLFEYFGLMDLPWKRLDEDCFDESIFVNDGGCESFPFANGHENFVKALAERFPKEKDGLRNFTATLKSVGDNIFKAFSGNEIGELFSMSAYGFLCENIHDEKLRKVLSGTSLKMELQRDTLPLYIFAQINNSFIQSAWRLHGGGSQIAERLASEISSMGGRVLNRTKVLRICDSDGIADGVDAESDGEALHLHADVIISDVHPAAMMSLLGESKSIRNIYRNRITRLPNSYGMFTAYISLKPGALKYINRNLYINRSDADLWVPDGTRTESVLVHFYVPEEGDYATHLDLISPMAWDMVSEYADRPKGHRGEEYEALKQRKAEECIALAEQRLPGLRDAIAQIWTSSPLTYLSYTGTSFGSAYGIRKDFNNPMLTVMSPRTPLKNLFMTGQSLNLHGMLGVSMTSVLTCACVPGLEGVASDILV
jgi:all-trans-retinol 13,14-reductase